MPPSAGAAMGRQFLLTLAYVELGAFVLSGDSPVWVVPQRESLSAGGPL